jgi:hypothetical protein
MPPPTRNIDNDAAAPHDAREQEYGYERAVKVPAV